LTNRLYIVQARPETVHSNRNMLKLKTYVLKVDNVEQQNILCRGVSVGNRIANGIVQVIEDVSMVKIFKFLNYFDDDCSQIYVFLKKDK
jgi:pyruvate,water dikinase